MLWPTARGSYLRQGRPLPIPADSDRDGLPDWWEMKYFFGPTNAVPQIDTDGDGMSNAAECRADTDPTDPGSNLSFEPPEMTRDGLLLRWHGGVRSRQWLEACESLTAPTDGWRALWTNEPSTSVTNSFRPPVAGDRQYYRLRVE
jgi:hypothetical protein